MESIYTDQTNSVQDWRAPDGFVNPVPEPGRFGRRLPSPSAPSRDGLGRYAGAALGLIVILVIAYGSEGVDLYNAFKAETPNDSASQFSPEPPTGQITLNDGAITALYTPADGDRVGTSDRKEAEFTATEWTLRNGNAAIALNDYRFEHAPVENQTQRDAYYDASAKEFATVTGVEVDRDPIHIRGRHGMVWHAISSSSQTYTLAEFPGDPHTVRIICRSDPANTSVAAQCDEIINSLDFAD